MMLQRHLDVYENPDSFLPERWVNEKSGTLLNRQFEVFLCLWRGGPNMCALVFS